MMSRARWSALFFLAPLGGLAAGCPSWVFDRGIPDGVQVACQTDDDCPQGEGAVYTCVDDLGRCVVVQTDGEQLEASGTASPASGGLGTTFTFAIAFVGNLLDGTAPNVQVRAADGSLHGTSRVDDSLTWTFTPTEGTVVGGPAEVVVTATGASGSVLTRVPVATFDLDFTAPALLGAASLDRAFIGDNSSLTVTVRFTEALGPAARLGVEGEDVWVDGTLADGAWSLVLSGDGLPEGPQALVVEAADPAGNQSGPLPIGDVIVDRTPPSAPSVDTQPRHLANGLIQVRFTFDEAVDASAATLEGRDDNDSLIVFQSAGAADREVVFTRSPSAVPVAGTYALDLTGIVDLAGNAADFAALTTIEIDASGPTLASFEASSSAGDSVTEADPPGTLLSAQPGDTLTVSLTFNEALSETPAVSVGSVLTLDASGEPVPDPVGPYVFETTLDGAAALEGEYNLTVSALDALGNQSVLVPLSVAVDTAPPQLIDVRFTPPAIAAGGTAILTVTTNEALASPPEVTWATGSPEPGFPTFIATGFSWTATLDVGSADDGIAPGAYSIVSVAMEDDAGNDIIYIAESGMDGGVVDGGASAQSDKLPATIVVDNQPVVIQTISLSGTRFSAVPGFNTVGVELQLDEAPGVDGTGERLLSVTLGTDAAPFSCAEVGDPTAWACTYDVVGDELGVSLEGPAAIDIEVVDAAGNVTTDRRVVVLDFAPPQVINPLLSPPTTNGDPVSLVFSVSEALLGGVPTDVTFTPALGTVTPLPPSGLTYFFSITTGSLPDGSYTLDNITVEDVVGNVATVSGSPAPSFVVDLTPPTAQILSASPARLSAVDGFDDLTLTLDTDGEPPANATLAVAGVAAVSLATLLGNGTCTPFGGSAVNCTYEGAGAEGPIGDEVTAQIVFEVVDAAGNRGVASAPIVIDRQPPDLVGTGAIVLPAPGNPLQAPTSLSATSTLQVNAALSEPVVGLSFGDARVVCPGGNVPLCPQALPAGATCDSPYAPAVLARQLLGQAPPGVEGESCAIEVDLVDLVGNTATATGDTVRVDQSPPSYLELNPSVVRHVRVPYGATVNGGERAQYLVASTWDGEALDMQPAPPGTCPGAACIPGTLTAPASEGIAALIVENVFGPVGQMAPDASGDWPPVRLSSVDDDVLYLVPVDTAGNRGVGFALVDAADWIGTLGGKEAGSTFLNPHRYHYRASHTDRLVDPSATELGFDSFIAREDGIATPVFFEDGQPRWLQRTSAHPPPRQYVAAAWDSVRQQTLTFGGNNASIAQSLSDQWAFDERGWREIVPVGPYNPSSRMAAAMAFDEARARLVMVGGSSTVGLSLIQDVWEFDGTSWAPVGSGPSGRRFATLAYHRGIGASVMFGGEDLGGYLDDTYLYRGGAFRLCDAIGSQGCTLSDPEGDGSPSARAAVAVAYDDRREEVVIFGGGTGSGRSAETWAFNGSSWRRAATSGPSARESAAMAYDRDRDVIVLYGGRNASAFSDTWEWNGSSWSAVAVSDPEGDGNPPTLAGHALVYDEVRDRVILSLGGAQTGNPVHVETWAFDGSSWERLRRGRLIQEDQQTTPDARMFGSMAFDSSRDTYVLFGGFAGQVFGDTWEYDGDEWTERSLTPSPQARDAFTMVYDEARGEVVVFGGRDLYNSPFMLDDTWVYDGVAWTERAPATVPPARQYAELVYDPRRQRVVLFGGQTPFGVTFGDTWEWDGTDWTQITPTDPEGDGNPSARRSHRLAFDPARGVVVMFGGTTTDTDFWEYDGVSWASRSPSAYAGFGPGQFSQDASLVYDPRLREVVSFGGTNTTGPTNLVASFNGYGWTDHSSIVEPLSGTPPSARRAMMGATNPTRSEVLFFGGFTGGSYSTEMWTLRLDEASRPAHVAQFDIGAARNPDPQDCADGTCPVERVQARFVGGANQTTPTSVLLYDVPTSGSDLVGTFGVDLTPNESLAALDGITSSNGVFWRLVVEDTFATVEGTLNSWCVSTNGDVPVCSDTARFIPEGFVIEESLRTDPSGPTSDVEVFVDITHQFAYDLDIRLEASTADPGAMLSVWQDGRFEPKVSHTSASAASLSWETTDPSEIARLFPGPERTFSLALEPLPGGAASPASAGLAADYVEVSLRYRASGL